MNTQAFTQAIPEILSQLLGFVIVFFILKRFAFGSIFKILDARRDAIANALREIEQKKADLEKFEKEYRAKLQNIEHEARVKIQEAVQDGHRISREIREKATAESLAQVSRAKVEIEREIEKARVSLREQMVNLATHAAEKILRKHLNAKEDEHFVREALKEAEKEIEPV